MRRPIDLDHIFKDKDDILPVFLQATRAGTSNAKENHWIIAWQVGSADGCEVHRRVHVVKEVDIPHLTNWGAITKATTLDIASSSVEIPLAKLNLSQRKKLEEIGNATPVYDCDGVWNCQDWVITVFEAAERAGILTAKEWRSAVEQAQTL